MKRNIFLLLAGIAIVPVGCTLAPKYVRPAAPIPAAWPQDAAGGDAQPAAGAPEASQLSWQEFFTDEKLRQVIMTALKDNRDLRLAFLNVERARAMYGIQRAELLPVFSAVGGGSKQRIPADLSSTGRTQIAEQYSVTFGAMAWEIDLFGRIRSLKDRALQEYLATEEASRSAHILLVSSVAGAYLTLAADHEGLALAETTLAAQQGVYDLIARRHDLGLADELDVRRAQTQADAARGDVARFRQLVALDENALNLLVGSPTPSHLLPTELDRIAAPKEIGAGLPSTLLLYRPDVLQAENLLRAADADIGAARAAFFPSISLTGTIGTASSDLSRLFKSGQDTWNFAPQAAMPIFDARTWSAYKVSKVQQKIALAEYEQAIQHAFKDVADALAVRVAVDQQAAAQESLVDALGDAYRLSRSRYDKGIDSYLAVLDAQRSLYAGQQGLVSLRLAKLTSDVRLYAALGGGW